MNLKPYETDASQIKGRALNVILPKTIAELKKAIMLNRHVCIRGAGSGLCGGAVPQKDVIIDMSKFSHILHFDIHRKIIEVEAGVILDELNDFLEQYGLEFPVKPSSHSIATIGGMIATNAVGSRAGKYGSTSRWINWIEIINSSGELLKKTTTELSDYAGMEGTTGVIIKASLRVVEIKEHSVSLIPYENIEELIMQTRIFKKNPDVSMVEFIDEKISEFLGLERKLHLIVEYESLSGEMKGGDYKKIMKIRDDLYPALAEKGYLRIEDPKILIDRIEKIISWLEVNDIPVFGHLSVGILHPCFNKKQEKLIPEMIKLVRKLNGQISGEHGIGLLKKQFLDANDKKIIMNVKKRCDAENKFNQGKIL